MSGHASRMMAQHVDRSFTVQPAILLLLVHALVAELANVDVSATAVNDDDDGGGGGGGGG